MKLFIIVLAVAVILVETEAGPQGRIINGYRANPGQFPYHVGFAQGREDDSPIACSGAIISNTWVLTAAHCIYGKPELTLHFGCTNFTAPILKQTINGREFFYHTEYNPATYNNDIGLIRTQRIDFNDKIKAVALPIKQTTQPDFVGDLTTVAGWGADAYFRYDPFYLNFAYLRVISNTECQKSHPNVKITEKMLCVSTFEGMSPCHGDSGGPLVLNDNPRLVGVVSFGSTQGCTRGLAGVFARVSEYLPWIEAITRVSYT